MEDEIVLLLCFGESRKKIKIKDNKYESLLEHLDEDDALRDYAGSDKIYQVYDNDFEDFIDLEPNCILENKAKVKVVLKEKRCIEDSELQLVKKSKLSENESNAASAFIPIDDEEPKQNVSITESVDNDRELVAWVAENQAQEVGNCSRTTFSLKYTLPDLPEVFKNPEKYNIVTNEEKMTMNKELRNILFSDLIKRFGLYPYHKVVAEQLVLTYPHLKTQPGDWWYNSLRSKFKNFRQNLQNFRTVAEHKQKYGKGSYKTSEPENRGSDVNEIMNVVRVQCSDLDSYEDEESVALHKNQMNEELKKTNIDWEIIDSKMDKTMANRRLIINKGNVGELLKEYPALANPRQIYLEFERKTKINIQTKFEEASKLYSEKIWKLVKKNVGPLKADILDEIKQIKNPTDMLDAKRYLSVLLIPQRFDENYQKFFFPKSEDASRYPKVPTIIYSGAKILSNQDFEVYVDGLKVTSVVGFKDAITIIIALYWILDVEYSTVLYKTLSFIESCYFGLKYTKCVSTVKRFEKFCRK